MKVRSGGRLPDSGITELAEMNQKWLAEQILAQVTVGSVVGLQRKAKI